MFRRPSLMRGNDVAVPEEPAHDRFEVIETFAARIGLVTDHHPCPLGITHGRRPAIRQQVDGDTVGRDMKEVIPGLAEQPVTLFASGAFERFDDFDPKRLGWEVHGSTS